MSATKSDYRSEGNPNWRGGKRAHPLYGVYYAMRARCLVATNRDYPNYGGRGITVCERWRQDFWAFVSDMGERPAGYSIERIDNDGNYEPSNCRWATRAEQNANKRKRCPLDSCRYGHEYAPQNTGIGPKGHRRCLTCAENRHQHDKGRKRNGYIRIADRKEAA